MSNRAAQLLDHHLRKIVALAKADDRNGLRLVMDEIAHVRPVQPFAYGIKDASAASALARSRLYQLFNEGALTPRKVGRRTIVLADELHEYLRNLPRAQIRQREEKNSSTPSNSSVKPPAA